LVKDLAFGGSGVGDGVVGFHAHEAEFDDGHVGDLGMEAETMWIEAVCSRLKVLGRWI
jgi:hypothetical protein